MTTVADSYCTAAEYRAGINPNKTDTGEDSEVLRDAEAITRYVEQKCGRFFGKDAADVTRDFYARAAGPTFPEAENPWKYAAGAGGAGSIGNSSSAVGRLLQLDTDLVSVTTILSDDAGTGIPATTWAATDYQLLPLNADKGPEARPYSALYVPTWSTHLWWPPGRMVRVTGVWGWPAIPASVKRGVIQLTAILRLESPRATSTVNEAGAVVGMSQEGKGIVRELVRMYGKVAM